MVCFVYGMHKRVSEVADYNASRMRLLSQSNSRYFEDTYQYCINQGGSFPSLNH